MFNAALCTVAKVWQQPKRPLTGEWRKKMWCMDNRILISLKKGNSVICDNRMNLKDMMLSETSQSQKEK